MCREFNGKLYNDKPQKIVHNQRNRAIRHSSKKKEKRNREQ